MNSGNYNEAIAAFESLNGYKDSKTKSNECLYNVRSKGRETISTGLQHTVGLKADGTVVAVGENFYGQCNVSKWENIKRPVVP